MGPFAGQLLSTLTLDSIQRLVTNSVPESHHLDYKRELKLDDRDDKKEFLRDITAFANSEGGIIIYGIEEDRDANGKPNGVPKSADGFTVSNRDAFVLMVEHIIKDGIDERLPSVQLSTMLVSADKYLLLISISPSFRATHMVTLGGERRFFLRGNSGRQEMSTAQLRDSVLKTESLVERAREFISNRTAKCRAILNNPSPFWALHVIPLVRDGASIDVTDAQVINRLLGLAKPLGYSTTHCLEGFKVSDMSDNGRTGYVITFRDGTVEFVNQDVFLQRPEPERYVAYGNLDEMIFRALGNALELYKNGPLQLPAVACLTLDRVDGYSFAPGRLRPHLKPPVVVEQNFSTDPIMILSLSTDPKVLIRPALDFIWNAFGRARCEGYDQAGRYVGYR